MKVTLDTNCLIDVGMKHEELSICSYQDTLSAVILNQARYRFFTSIELLYAREDYLSNGSREVA
jgi:hypothetical protein